MNELYSVEAPRQAWDGDDALSSSTHSRGSSDTDSTDADGEVMGHARDAEVTALCWSGASVGVARYLCAECRIEVFEARVCVVAGEAVRRRRSGGPSSVSGLLPSRRGSGGDSGGGGDIRILVHEDVPPSLLWLVRYLEVHQPQVLLPHTGSEALGDLVGLLAAQTPIEVIRLSATSAFNAAEALPRLAAMYPAREAELANRFHVENTAMMRAMAALLQFVAAGQSNVADVVERGVLHAMYLDDACAEALQITRTERHPNSAQGRGRAKEGLSLRSLLSTTQSSLGKAMLRQWTALPCCDVAEIDERQSVVAFFVQVEQQTLAAQLRAALHHVRATSHIFTTMRSGRAMRKHYVSLYRTVRGVIQVQRLLCRVAHEVSRLHVLLQSIAVEPLVAMAEALARTIVGVVPATAHTSLVQNRVPVPLSAPYGCGGGAAAAARINDGVDAVLDELRLRLHELRLSLQAKAEAAFEQLPWELRARLSLRCVYAVPHGYLLCVPAVELTAVVREYVPEEVPVAPEEEGKNRSASENSSSDGDSEGGADAGADGITTGRAEGSTVEPRDIGTAAAASTTRERVCRFMFDAFQWQFHHETQDGEFCFKSAAMEELDTWVGDLQWRVQQRERQVGRELDTSLLYASLHLLRPTRALGELDCLLSFAHVSAQEGWCRPEMLAGHGSRRLSPEKEEKEGRTATGKDAWGDSNRHDGGVEDGEEVEEEGVLEINNGWHPLLSRQLGLQQLVPFSLHLRTSTDRVCVVLGVNGSGKSVLLNAVAHIVFLAHVGCHVPAAAARMSLINGIFTPSSCCASSLVMRLPLAGVARDRPGLCCGNWGSGAGSSGGGGAAVAAAQSEAEAAQSSFYGECVALHRVLHHVAGQQRAATATEAVEHGQKREAARCVDGAAGRALVLLDEFGRGTAPEDGCALLKGTLRFFAAAGGSGGGGASATAAAAVNTEEIGEGNTRDAAPANAVAALAYAESRGRLVRGGRWQRAPIVLCATHLVEVFDVPSTSHAPRATHNNDNNNTAFAASESTQPAYNDERNVGAVAGEQRGFVAHAIPAAAAAAAAVQNTEVDPPLPLEWFKIYDMETLTTYAPNDELQIPAFGGNETSNGKSGSSATECRARCRLPMDVIPTYHPVCITPHTGIRRWEDWQQHSDEQLDAGPALGRQCGLDPELLACWESALHVLHSTP